MKCNKRNETNINHYIFHRKGKISTTVVTSDGPQEREEVFYTIPLQGRRRHSVGGYLATGGAGAGEVTTVPSEVPKMPAPKFSQQREDEVKRRRPKNFPFKGLYNNNNNSSLPN